MVRRATAHREQGAGDVAGILATSIALYQYAGGNPRDLVPAYTRFRAARS